MILNYMKETEAIETVDRYNGGWLKRVTGLDKSVNNGYSIVGDFVEAGNYKSNYEEGLYLDCSKEGSRKNQVWNYHLFRFSEENGVELLQTLEDAGRTWAVSFWETIEKELAGGTGDKVQDILNSIYEESTNDETLLKVVLNLLDKINKTEDKITIIEKMLHKKIIEKMDLDNIIEQELNEKNIPFTEGVLTESQKTESIAKAYLTHKCVVDESKYSLTGGSLLLSEVIGTGYTFVTGKLGEFFVKLNTSDIEVVTIWGN